MNPQRLRSIVQPGIEAVRLLWLPFALIQLAGLLLVITYFYVPAVAHVCDRIGAIKTRYGLLFAAATMPIACGIVPEIFKFVAGVDRSFTRQRLSRTLHNMALFCVSGVVVDLFYLWLNHTFAGVPPVWSVPSKVLIDQLIYTPVLGVPMISIAYTLRHFNYRPLPALREFGPAWYERDVLPVLVTNWAYWFPMTSLMYTLPPTLTFAYALVASAASTILLTAIAGRRELAIPEVADRESGV